MANNGLRMMTNKLTSAILLPVSLLAVTSTAAAQHKPQRSVPKPIDFATSQNDNLFSLVRSQDDIHAIELAQEELAEGKNEAAVRRLHELLRIDPGGVIPVAPGRYLGIRTVIVTVLANMSPAAKAEHEQLALREARTLLGRPIHEFSPRQLEAAATRFPTTQKGLAARTLLGDRALERGNGLLAANHFRKALDATTIGSDVEQRIVARLASAAVLADPKTALAQKASKRLTAAGDEVLPVVPTPPLIQSAIGGGRSGATPMDEPTGHPRAYWREDVYADSFDREKGQLAMFPVGDLDGIYVNTGRELIAFDPLRKEIQWVSQSPLRDLGQVDRPREITRQRGQRGRRRGRGRMYDPTTAINQDMVLSSAVDQEVVVCALQVPDSGQTVTFQQSFEVITKIPRRRMYGFSRQTGKRLWSHFDELDGRRTKRYRGHDSCGPPLIAGDTLYAPIQDRTGAIAFSIAAYDLQTGVPKWRRLVCSSQQDVNMFGNARMEFASSPLCLHGGVLYGATNLGVAFAVDALSGRLRWITSYDVVHMPESRLHGQADRQVFFANNPPVVNDGIVCMTPLDSQFALGLDIDSGTINWRLPFDAQVGGIENRVQWLCGAIDDEFILSGVGIVAVKARPEDNFGTTAIYRQMVRPDQIGGRRFGMLPARAAVTEDHVWVPTRDKVLAFDRSGQPHEKLPITPIDGYKPGNLMLVDGVMVSLRNNNFDLMIDSRAMLERSQVEARNAPNSPDALLRLATLQDALLNNASTVQDRKAVQELYRRGLEACIAKGLPKSHPTRLALQRELFNQAQAVATTAARNLSPDTLQLLVAARKLAPDLDKWLQVQVQVLAQSRRDRDRFLTELTVLEQHAPSARMPLPLEMSVAAFVLWQRAIAHEYKPAEAADLWQRLLEQFGDERLGTDRAATVAEDQLSRLIKTHGKDAYGAIAKRADAALSAAGEDEEALRSLTSRYPNSEAARRAGLMLLDKAVMNGNLAATCEVLARATRTDTVSASVLRRVQVAALRRGNVALARTMADRIKALPDAASDWPEDKGMTYIAAAEKAIAALPPITHVAPALPSHDVMQVPPRSRQEYLRMLPTRIGRGFPRPKDTPLYVVAGSELVAFDLEKSKQGTELFAEPVEFLEHALVCGEILVVPDMERVVALDYRTGETRWALTFETPRLIESLGITAGVLHVLVQPQIPDGKSDLIGLEPITGTQLFTRALLPRELKPKPINDQLLLMKVQKNDVTVARIDAVTGETLTTINCSEATRPGLLELRPDSLATRLYPQRITGDHDRVYLTVDGRNQNVLPQVIALDNKGKIAWHWQGTSGHQLLLEQRRGPHYVVAESSDMSESRMVMLDIKTGKELRSSRLGHDATVLNWERTWLDNPLPKTLAVGSQTDRQSRQRQLICFAVDKGPSFAVALKPDDGDVERAPQFGKAADGTDFVTFGVRPRRAGGVFRLYAIDVKTRAGAFAGKQKTRSVQSLGPPHGMSALGPYTVLSTTQGLILLDANAK